MHACHIEDVHVQPLASFVGNPFVTAPQFMPTFHTCLLISPLAQATPQGTEWPHDTMQWGMHGLTIMLANLLTKVLYCTFIVSINNKFA